MSPPRLTLFESGASQALDAVAHRVLDADCIAVHPCDGSQHVAASFRIPSPNDDIAAFCGRQASTFSVEWNGDHAADKLVVPKSNGAVP